jgi:hypothetical protein
MEGAGVDAVIRLLLAFGDAFLWLLLCMAITAAVIGLTAGLWALAAAAIEHWATRGLPDPLTAHHPEHIRSHGRSLPRRIRPRHVDRLVMEIEQRHRTDAHDRGLM